MSDTPDLEFLALQEALVGRYSLVKELGRGGMGIVYLAHEVALVRPVALKLLPPEYAAQPALRGRFIREAQTGAKLSHPNVVPIYAVDEVDNFVFFTMAYVEGESLGERIRGRGPLPAGEATRVLREVAWALAYGHGQGVVHRDVKPDNILLEAGSGRALLTDFGIAQVSEGPGMTGANEVLGTAEFMSPEQAAGDPIDERSDLYSLAVVGHYILSGQLPFQGETVAATLAKHMTLPAPPLATVAPEVPSNLAKAMDRCLAKDPAERFEDGEQLAGALSRALEVKREMPVALRAFIENTRERLAGGSLIVGLAAFYFVFSVIVIVQGVEYAFIGWIMAAFTLAFGVAPISLLIRMARDLLRSGYSHQVLLLALKNDLDARREEIAFHRGATKNWVDRLGFGLLVGGLAAAVGGTAAMMALPMSFAVLKVVGIVSGSGALAALVGGPISSEGFGKGRGDPGTRWLKFWKSRFGKTIFKLAGLRLQRVTSESSAHRPTEMAIGMAADRLFEELPKDVKGSLSELPSIVRKLEEDAEKMRARVKELDKLIDNIEHDEALGSRATAVGGSDVSDRRKTLAADLQKARDGAQKRLTEAVGALETVRLGLLRIHAGAGTVESMTQDLSAARALSDDLEHLHEGTREVEALLGKGK